MARARIRDLGIVIGSLPPGTANAITDVPGVLVGHTTLIYDEPRVARTGVTVILPRRGEVWTDHVFAGIHSLNGAGELTGSHWVEESGLLTTPIGLTNTHQVGEVRDGLVAYGQEHGWTSYSSLPVVAETYDGWLNDLDAFHLRREHVFEAIASAHDGKVEEGCVGGGTGMICHDFKGGIGTASRSVSTDDGSFTVGALVQANYGERRHLRVDGLPVGAEIGFDRVPSPWDERPKGGSIIVILATDAPLLPVQCRRLAQRATIGLARVGGMGHNTSGDLFLAFSTGNHFPAKARGRVPIEMLPHQRMNPLFEAAAEATEEAILNALTMAETTTGFRGRTAHALPLDELQAIVTRFRRLDTRQQASPAA